MELVQKIEKNDLLASDWGIYKLNDEEAKKYGGKFALSQGVFTGIAIDRMGVDELSVSPSRILAVRDVVRKLDLSK